jgi:hypothetical protein
MARLLARCSAQLLLLVGFVSLPVEAQLLVSTPPAQAVLAPQDFGGDTQNLVIGATEFAPRTTLFAETNGNSTAGTKWVESGSLGHSSLWATMNGRIPNGARITSICAYGVDNVSGTHNVAVQLRRNFADAIGGGDSGIVASSLISSSGTPGDFAACEDVNILVDSRYDIDGDGAIEMVDYTLVVFFGNGDYFGDDLQIRFVRIAWHRQVSPAPASATFGDVPVGHPQFQFVEALFAAGITAGCGGGNYCPDAPLTRGQMAVFLAAALGLHWPAF